MHDVLEKTNLTAQQMRDFFVLRISVIFEQRWYICVYLALILLFLMYLYIYIYIYMYIFIYVEILKVFLGLFVESYGFWSQNHAF